MTETKIDSNFVALFHQLMKTSFMVATTPEFGAKPAEANVMKLVAAGAPHLPALFRTRYADHVVERMDSLFTRLHANPFAVETFTEARKWVAAALPDDEVLCRAMF